LTITALSMQNHIQVVQTEENVTFPYVQWINRLKCSSGIEHQWFTFNKSIFDRS
jgi:hypothetical protein